MLLKKQLLESDMEQWTGSKLGKEYIKAVYCHSAYLTYMESTSWETPGWWVTSWNQDCREKYQQPQTYRWYYFNCRKQRGTKELPVEGERIGWKVGLKFNIQKTKTMTFGPITSWQIQGEKMEAVTDFILLGSKITADGDCSHEIKRHLLLGRQAMTNLDSILKSRYIILLTKFCMVKSMGFPVVVYGCESWTIQKAECQRIDAFKLWCWRRLLRAPCTARGSN